MTDNPRTLSRTRKLARKVVPLRARKVFVATVDTRLKKAGKHHKVAAVSRLIADWDACSDPPEESCADAGCPVHGDDEYDEPEWDSEDSNAYVADQEAAEAAAWRESRP